MALSGNWLRSGLLVAMCAVVTSCTLPAANSTAEATVQELSAEHRSAIAAIFAQWSAATTPGCAVGVYRDGALVYAQGFGAANLEHDIPNTPRTVFDLGSVSKQFTAGCVALLVAEGKLAIDDDIRRYVPELPEYDAPITVRHLLHHTSGLHDYTSLLALKGVQIADYTTLEQALDAIARMRVLAFTPGAQHEYSNSGYFLLGLIVARVSGVSLARFADERFFAPLGMRHTHFHDDHRLVVPARATGYSPRAENRIGIDMSDWEQVGDGAVMTTVEDLAHWDRNFQTGEVGGPRWLALMGERGQLGDGSAIAYGWGLVHGSYRGLVTISHGGAWAGYRAALLRFPSERLTIACLANRGDLNPVARAREVADVVLADRLAPREQQSRSGTLRDTRMARSSVR
ncbi:MAG: serine hydrolase domain-containing protein [Planctomycetota bacterium]